MLPRYYNDRFPGSGFYRPGQYIRRVVRYAGRSGWSPYKGIAGGIAGKILGNSYGRKRVTAPKVSIRSKFRKKVAFKESRKFGTPGAQFEISYKDSSTPPGFLSRGKAHKTKSGMVSYRPSNASYSSASRKKRRPRRSRNIKRKRRSRKKKSSLINKKFVIEAQGVMSCATNACEYHDFLLDQKRGFIQNGNTIYLISDHTTPGTAEIDKMALGSTLTNVKAAYQVNAVVTLKNNYEYPVKIQLMTVEYKQMSDRVPKTVLIESFDNINHGNIAYELDIGGHFSDLKRTNFDKVFSTKVAGSATLQPGQEYVFRNKGKKRIVDFGEFASNFQSLVYVRGDKFVMVRIQGCLGHNDTTTNVGYAVGSLDFVVAHTYHWKSITAKAEIPHTLNSIDSSLTAQTSSVIVGSEDAGREITLGT